MKKIIVTIGLLMAMLLAGMAAPTAYADEGDPVSTVEGVEVVDDVDGPVVHGRIVDSASVHVAKDCFSTKQKDQWIRTCIKVGWREQTDGTGVAFEDVWITTPEGCGLLDGDIYRNVEPAMYKHPEHTFIDRGNWGNDGCTTHHDFAWRGAEYHSTDFRLELKYQRDCYLCPPYTVVWRSYFTENGSYGREAFRIE